MGQSLAPISHKLSSEVCHPPSPEHSHLSHRLCCLVQGPLNQLDHYHQTVTGPMLSDRHSNRDGSSRVVIKQLRRNLDAVFRSLMRKIKVTMARKTSPKQYEDEVRLKSCLLTQDKGIINHCFSTTVCCKVKQ